MLLLPCVGGNIPCGLNTIWEVFTRNSCFSPEQDVGEDEGGEDEPL